MPTINLRFHTFPVPASERPRDLFTFYVTGSGYFPVDMLRYDQCWPADGDSAATIADSIGYYATREATPPVRWTNRSIKMRSHREPACARWSSFGWSCSADKLGS
jgi:hypothetical protein